ncbi:MAG: DUF445 family protein [Ketobacteraceae bacterium]|nr:DUF445 family protein [Ketobacteraceae bacterium]
MTLKNKSRSVSAGFKRLTNMKLSDIDFAGLDAWVRRGLLLGAAGFGLLQYFFPDQAWLKSCFIVIMAGNVGYFTNFMAIKMLFQPKQGQVLGWRGLVPQNQPQIAESLAETVQTQLLSPDIIIAYVNENDLLHKGLNRATRWLDDKVHDSDFRNNLTEKVVLVLKDRGPDLLNHGFDFSEQTLKDIAENPRRIEQVWQSLRESLLDYLEQESNREKTADFIQRVLLTELPRLSDALNEAFEEYLRRKKTAGSIGLGLKRIASFDTDAIQELLQRFAKDPETSNQILGMLDVALERLREHLEQEQTKQVILDNVQRWIDQGANHVREQWLPGVIERLEGFLDDERNWQTIEKQCIEILTWMKNRSVEYLQSREGEAFIKAQITVLVHRLNVTSLVEEQVRNLDTDDLEKMILDNTGGNLVVIQVLGGGLGMIAGLIQVHIGFSVPVLILIAIVWLDAQRNKRRFG